MILKKKHKTLYRATIINIVLIWEHIIDMYPCVCWRWVIVKRWLGFGLVFKTNHDMSVVCATCLLPCDIEVWSTKMVDDNEEGQASLCRWTGTIVEGQTWRLGPRDREPEGWLWVANIWGHWRASVHVEIAQTMLTMSRQRLTRWSGGVRTWWSNGRSQVVTLVEIMEEVLRIHDSRWVWWFRPQNRGSTICRV